MDYFLPFNFESKVENIFSTRLLKNIYGSLSTRVSEYFFMLISELWFGQYSYQYSDEKDIQSYPPVYQIPTVDLLHASEMVVRHVCSAICLPVTKSSVSSIVQSVSESAFNTVRIGLYRFLRLNLYFWPSDSTFSTVGSLWVVFIAPWKYTTTLQSDLVSFW